PPIAELTPGTAPAIPTPEEGEYTGERLDLTRIDLGAYLDQVQKSRKLGKRVVLQLSGAGERHTSPIHVKGSSLVLFFEHSDDKDRPEASSASLALIPSTNMNIGDLDALIQVDDGDLEIFGGEVHFPNFQLAL